MDRRGFLTLLGGALLASPAMAQTAGGVLVPVPQRIIGDRLVIEDLVLRGITIRNCHIVSDGGYGVEIMNCNIEHAAAAMTVEDTHVSTSRRGVPGPLLGWPSQFPGVS